MFKSFFRNRKWFVWAYGGGILLFVSLLIQVELSVALNGWYGGFYDLLQKANEHNVDEFWQKIKDFTMLAVPYIIIATATAYFSRVYAFRWREAMTFGYVDKWRDIKFDIEGSSQRIQEDCYRFAKILETLGLQFVRAVMTLIAFVPILWTLSSGVEIPIIKDINGSLVWIAFLISLGGLLAAWIVGIKLPGLEYNNQKVEAAFRKELVYAEDDKINYASPNTIMELFTGLKFNYHKLFFHYGYFDMYLNFYMQFTAIAVWLIMAPSLFSGLITLGVIMQVSNAFEQVNSSFSLLTQQWVVITELRLIYKRLREFEASIGFHAKNDVS